MCTYLFTSLNLITGLEILSDLSFIRDINLLCICGKQNNAPQYVHVLMSETCGYVALSGKKDFAM